MILLRFPTRETMLSYLLAESMKAKRQEPRTAIFHDYSDGVGNRAEVNHSSTEAGSHECGA